MPDVEQSFDNLPNTWKKVALGEAAHFSTGGGAPQGGSYFQCGKHPFVRVQHFDGTEKYLRRWDLITDEAVKDYRLKLFPKETILFPKSGASIYLEKRTKLPFDAYVVGHLCCVQPSSGVHGDFLFFLLRLLRFSHAVDGSTLPYLNLNQLQERLIPLPPLPEQRKIAAVLGLVQQAIEQQEQLLALTTELKKALLHHLFTHGLRGEPQKQTEIGPMPLSWEVKPLGDLVVDAPHVNMRSESLRIIRYIDVSSISREFLRIESTASYVLKDAPGRARKKIIEGDVIFATVRPTLLRVARIAREFDNQVCSTAFCVLRDKNTKTCGRFIYYLLQRERFVRQLAAIESGASYPAVTDRQVKAQPVPVPKDEEQLEIAQVLEACDAKINMHASKTRMLTALFRTLLQQLMTAQIRVDD